MLATTVRLTGDVDLAEDAVQEAYVRALRAWCPSDLPRNPAAWLTTTARRVALNAMTREANLRTKLPLLLSAASDEVELPEPDEPAVVPDDRLRLVFTCCHPSLSQAARLALTLRVVCGIATPDVARVLLTSESAMAARITRAKKKIKAAGIPYEVPTAEDLPARTHTVVTVLYLMYTVGHTAPSGEQLSRDDVTERATRLARTMRELVPGDPEVAAVLALMLFSQSRARTRHDGLGRLVRLQDQDRSRWDKELISEGLAHLGDALATAGDNRLVLEAAIAAKHATALCYDDTDWRGIRMLYDRLLVRHPSPVVALNRAIAVSHCEGAEAGLDVVEALIAGGQLDDYVYLHATKGELSEQLGRYDAAMAAYRRAIALTGNAVEQRYLRGRVSELERLVHGA